MTPSGKVLGSIPSKQLQCAKVPFPNILYTLGICTPLPYGTLKAETASMLATKTG
jgi:hypothetical protein